MLLAIIALAGSLVNPFIGTGASPGGDQIDDFPGASAPFGMVQWSPDTPSQPASGGYLYKDTSITGFSLTHLAGAGCSVFGDFSVFPTVGTATQATDQTATFSHADEAASPGYYMVTLGNGTRVRLAATQRTGFGEFTYPGTSGNLIINAASAQSGASSAAVRFTGPNTIEATVTEGAFCGMPNVLTIYLAMRFNRPFVAHGLWKNGQGGWLTFDTTNNKVVAAQAAISYVSPAAAQANLAAEKAKNLYAARIVTSAAWDHLLGEVQVAGGTTAEQTMLATALYHVLLSPTIYSDVDGRYLGFDNKVHRVRAGHAEYANYSGWDIYRAQVPMMAMLAPQQTGDMMQSLVDAAHQGGWLPKWPVGNGYSAVMGGDPASPIIGEAYAFGAHDFDTAGALAAMRKNADDTTSPPGQGWYRPRPGLEEYLARGYVVNDHTNDVSPVPNGASGTLEYALDDFAVSQFAIAIGKSRIASTYAKRSMNWTSLFNTARGYITPRDSDGAFAWHDATDNGQSGFQEGNAAQYTWMVPQSPATLVAAMGGRVATQARLDTFFTKLNAGQTEPYAWLGNEPSLIAPWMYMYVGAPYKAQAINRTAMLTLYNATPNGLPGNDDLGTMSAWWAWTALGIYPYAPGTPLLLFGTPLFTHVSIASPAGYTINIDAPNASDTNRYVTAVTINEKLSQHAWTMLPSKGVLNLNFTASDTPNTAFGSAVADAPPSYVHLPVTFPASTMATLAFATGTVSALPDTAANLQLVSSDAAVTWTIDPQSGFAAQPVTGIGSGSVALILASSVRPGLYDIVARGKAANGALLPRTTAVVRIAATTGALPLGYVANYSDDTVTPIDPVTRAYGAPIKVGKRPGDLAVSPDGNRLYTANQGSDDVTVIDTTTGATVATVKVGKVPAGIALSPNGETLWIANYTDGTLQSINTATLKADASFAVGAHPEGAAISPDGARLYVVNQGDAQLAVVDAHTHAILARIPLGRNPQAIVISKGGTRIYVTNSSSNDVSVIDATRMVVIARVTVGKGPQGLDISPDGTTLYVADSSSDEVTPIDLRNNRALAPIRTGTGPYAVLFTADGKTALTADSGDNAVGVIDVAKKTTIAHIHAGSFPISIRR